MLARRRCSELLEDRVGLLRGGQVEGLQEHRHKGQELRRGATGVVVLVHELWEVLANRFEHGSLGQNDGHGLDVALVHDALVWQRDEPVVHLRIVGDDRSVERGEGSSQEGWVAGRGLQGARVIQEGLSCLEKEMGMSMFLATGIYRDSLTSTKGLVSTELMASKNALVSPPQL